MMRTKNTFLIVLAVALLLLCGSAYVRAAPGDDCTDPIVVNLPADLDYSDLAQTNCGRGNTYSSTCLGSYDGGDDIIYELNVTSAVDIDVLLDPKSTTWTGIALDDACPLDPSTCLYKSTNSSASAHGFTGVSLAPGTYYIMIDTYPSPYCIPDFDLTITAAAGPQAGDDCSLPIPISLPAALPYSDLGQTNCGRNDNYDATCLGYYDGGEDIIYEVTVTSAIVNVVVTLDPKSTTYTGIALDDACPLDPSTCLYTHTQSGASPHGFSIDRLDPGTYYIQVDTWPSPNCIPDFDLTITGQTPPANDMATNSIDDVPDLIETGSVITVKATVQNKGTATANAGVPVKLKIDGPLGYVYTDYDQATTQNLGESATEQIVFSPDWNVPDTLCSYTITVWTELGGDEDPSNDTLVKSVTVYRAGGIAESFTGTAFPPPGWTSYNFDGGDAWLRYTSYYHTAPACARVSYDVPNDDWLITPRLKAVTGDKLKFWWRAGSASYTEECLIRVSTDPDVSDTSAYTVVDQVTGNSTDWAEKVVDLSAYDGQDIYIAFHCISYDALGMVIDDVTGPYFPCQIAVSPDSFYVESFPDTTFDEYMYIGNVGGGNLGYRIRGYGCCWINNICYNMPGRTCDANGGTWEKGWCDMAQNVCESKNSHHLTVDPDSGSVPGGEEDTITLSFNTAGLDGHYYDTLEIVSNSGEKQDGDTVLVPVHLYVPLIPDISIEPDSFAVGVEGNGTEDTAMFISNTGSGDLEYSIETEEYIRFGDSYSGEPPHRQHGEAYKSILPDDPRIEEDKGTEDSRRGVPPAKGQGGPDGYGYRWIDSDEPGGPTYDWVEINSVGTLVDLGDDQNLGPFDIGFTFNFYGNDFTQFQVCSNGFVSFTSTSSSLTNYAIPTTNEPNNLLALMWDDLNPGTSGQGDVYYYNDGSRLIIEYDGVIRYGCTTCPYTMEIILYPNGKIIYQYKTMGGDRQDEATIGIENADGTDGLEVVYNAYYVHDELAIRFSAAPEWIVYSPESGTVPPSETDTIDVTFDATGILSGDFYGAFLISSNAPDKALDTVPCHMTILTPEMTFDPESLVTSATEGQAPYDLTMDIGNAGDARLIFDIVEGIPWLSASPLTDTVDAGEGPTTITLTIDCTDLYAGKYLGEIEVYSNDPDLQPYALYRVYLSVGPDPDIDVTPDSFYIGLYAGLTLDTTMNISNTGDGHLVWAIIIEEITPPKSPDTLLWEDFEGSWPPSGWSDPDDWNQDCSGYYMCEGLCGALVLWGYSLDEWLITPSLTLGAGSYVKFCWESSFYWSVDPYDNADLFVKISTNGGTNWDILWTFGDSAMVVNSGGPWPWDSFIMYEATLDLSAYSGEALIAFNVVADDNADIAIDAVVVESFGAPWIAVSPESGVLDPQSGTDVTVSFSSIGVTDDKYANLWVTSNDPDEDPVLVPVHLEILGPEYSISPPETLVIDALEDQYTDGHLYVSNFGGHAPLIYKMTDPVAWLSESPDSENVAIDGTQDVTVTVDGYQLISGDYETFIAIETNDFDEGHDTIIVVVHVGPDACIETDPDSFDVQVSAGGIKDTTLTITNDCDGHLGFEITTEETGLMLGAEPDQDRFYEILERNKENHPSGSAASSSPGTENARTHLTAVGPDGASLVSPPGSPIMGKGDTVFIQLPHDPEESWSMATTDQGAGYKLYENFWGVTLPISDIHWWGLALIFSGGWLPGDPNNLVFDITFYSDPPDDPNLPPTEVVCTYYDVVPPVITTTGQQYAGFDMYFFDGVELSPLCDLSEGWVSIQSKSPGEGYDWLLWASAKTGDGFSYQEGASPPERYYDQAMILTGGAAWLTVSPEADTVEPHSSVDVIVTFDATEIMGGEKFGNIIIEHNAPDKGTTIVPVHMVIGGAYYAITPEELNIDALEDEYTTAYLAVSNPGGEAALSYKMTCPVPWILVNPDTADVDPDQSLDVSVRVDGYMLIAGDYYTEIAVKTNAVNQQYDTIPVSVHVGPDPDIDLAPLSFEIGVIPGCIMEKRLMVGNVGLGHLGFVCTIEQTPPLKTDVLMVDDDNSAVFPEFTDVVGYFTDALDANGYTYDIFEVTSEGGDGPDAATMAGYPVVIWSCGESWANSQTLTSNDEANLATYLDGGGSLFLSAHDYFWDRYPSAGSFSPGQFPYDYLGVTFTSQDLWIIVNPAAGTATGMPGSVAEGMTFDLWDPYTTMFGSGGKGPDDGLYIDEIVHNGVDLFQMIDPSPPGIAACQYEVAKGFKTVFTTVDFAGLIDGASPSTRAEFMGNIMNWFLGAACPFTVTPEADTLDPLTSTDLVLTFDGAAFEACGVETLTCYVVFNTNDPDETTVTVPVTMWSARGDVTMDCAVNVADLVFLLNHVFGIGPAPDPLCLGDVDRDGDVDSDDALYLASYLFLGGPPPEIPTAPKGEDETEIKTVHPTKQTSIQRK